jgi:hypothetical protein
MRSAIAEHQGNWPAVAADPGNPGYQKSIATLRAASEDFIRWMREQLAQVMKERKA